MAGLYHPNLVNFLGFGEDEPMYKKGKLVKVNYLVLELVSGGELFDFIADCGKFSEPVARFYFR